MCKAVSMKTQPSLTSTEDPSSAAPAGDANVNSALIFRGRKTSDDDFTVHVIVDGEERPLPLRLELRNHSPTGFCWGYTGSGPAQLALAMCAEVVDTETALRAYQHVKSKLIATLPMETREWTISGAAVRDEIILALS